MNKEQMIKQLERITAYSSNELDYCCIVDEEGDFYSLNEFGQITSSHLISRTSMILTFCTLSKRERRLADQTLCLFEGVFDPKLVLVSKALLYLKGEITLEELRGER